MPGRLYRSNHPLPWQLAALVRRHGIATIINLRGERVAGSNALTVAVAARLGLDHIYLPFESRGAPQRERVLRFAELYRTMRAPALVHCKSGADRAGLAAGIAILLEGGSAAQAARQLSWRFLHVRRSPAGILDAFFARYAAEAEGRLDFIEWVRNEYDADALRRDFRAGRLSALLTDRLLRRE